MGNGLARKKRRRRRFYCQHEALIHDLRQAAPGVFFEARIMPNGWLVATATFVDCRKISFHPPQWNREVFHEAVNRVVSAWIEKKPYRRYKKPSKTEVC